MNDPMNESLSASLLEIRIHGRGGQGNVRGAYLLAQAAVAAGFFAQAFPFFGAERRGAPVAAFARLSPKPFYRHCQVEFPHHVIVQDAAIARLPETLSGLREGGTVLANGSEESAPDPRMRYFPATALALEFLGAPIPNTALLAAFVMGTGMFPLDALKKALEESFSGKTLEKNLALVEKAASMISPGELRYACS